MSINRSIFRPEALQRYKQSSGVSVLAYFSRPLNIAILWSAVILCLLSGMMVGLLRVPIYITASVIARNIPMATAENKSASWVVLIPARYLSQLQVNQTINLLGRAEKRTARGAISIIEPQTINPETARIRFGLNTCASPESLEPLAVVIADLTRLPSSLTTEVEPENRYQAEIEVSTKRIGAFFPGIGSWYDQ